jgi:hypothetical protein
LARTDDATPWKCPNGHIIGHVEHEKNNTYLARYEKAIDLHWPMTGTSPVILDKIIGKAEIGCTICHAKRDWHWIDAATERLVGRQQERYAASK